MKGRTEPLPEEATALRGEALDVTGRPNKPVYSIDWLTASTVLGLDDPFHPLRDRFRHLLPDELERNLSWRPLIVPLIACFLCLMPVIWCIFSVALQKGISEAFRVASETRDTAIAKAGNPVGWHDQ